MKLPAKNVQVLSVSPSSLFFLPFFKLCKKLGEIGEKIL